MEYYSWVGQTVRDYLGTWKSPEASARWYRERAGALLQKLTRFYGSLGIPKVHTKVTDTGKRAHCIVNQEVA